jgi:hypothetical protein
LSLILDLPTHLPRSLILEVSFRLGPNGRKLLEKAKQLRQDFLEASTAEEMYEVAEKRAYAIGSIMSIHHHLGYNEEEERYKRVYRWFQGVAQWLKCKKVEEIIRKI